nr:immunoglobulin light chain junction region [Macaca mulatta]MOX50243.1 immunoglobulin light chain junction region [Macaca mulatta]MOX50281.1 immunoglobulin light chain junction region [Macaca mulatta]
CQHYYAKPLTF